MAVQQHAWRFLPGRGSLLAGGVAAS